MRDRVVFDDDGLVPGIVQNATTGRVLMLGYLTARSLELTMETGEVHFWSRSRQTMWHKGATSGNTMRLVEALPDCDGDAVLLRVEPAGPACHTGSSTCFDDGFDQGFAWLEGLWATINQRAEESPEISYTAQLLDGGTAATGAKVIEEAGEVVEAAVEHSVGTSDDRRVAEEAADLAYHLLVLLAERGIKAEMMLDVLRERARPNPERGADS